MFPTQSPFYLASPHGLGVGGGGVSILYSGGGRGSLCVRCGREKVRWRSLWNSRGAMSCISDPLPESTPSAAQNKCFLGHLCNSAPDRPVTDVRSGPAQRVPISCYCLLCWYRRYGAFCAPVCMFTCFPSTGTGPRTVAVPPGRKGLLNCGPVLMLCGYNCIGGK